MKIHTLKGVFKVLLIPALALFNSGFSAINYFNPEVRSTIPQKLSLSGIYTGKTISPEAVPYGVNVPEWTDSIPSFRYILVKAPGKIIFGDTTDYYGYPDNVIFVRTLYIDTIKGNPASRKFFETRLLVKGLGKDKWFPLNYVWNKEQTDAEFTGEEFGFMGVNYTISSATGSQTHRWSHDEPLFCQLCHEGRGVNGFLTAQLNRPSPVNPLENQIKYLFEKSVFSGTPPTNYLTLPKWVPPSDNTASLDLRVRSYLAAQCSQCHGMRYEVEASQDMKLDYHAMIDYSYIKTPPPAGVKPHIGLDSAIGHETTAPVPSCDESKLIFKGDPDASSIYYRMNLRSTDPTEYDPHFEQMPPTTSFLTDTDALKILYKWICNMDPVMCATPDGEIKPGTDRTKCQKIVADNPSPSTNVIDRTKKNRIIPFPVPLIKNRVLHVPSQYTAGNNVEVFMIGIHGREKRLTRVGKDMFVIDASVPTGVYVFRINEYSFKKVVF